jgi:hypothetical protein
MASPTARKIALMAVAVVLVILLIGLPSWGQDAVEPSGELASADCYGHHKQEGFRSMDLLPTVVTEVPKGTPFSFALTIKNPWLHDLQHPVGYVNISNAPGLSFPGARDPVATSANGTVQNGQKSSAATLQVDPNATQMIVSMVGTKSGTPLDSRVVTADYSLLVQSPDGSLKLTDGSKPPATSGAPISPGQGRTASTVVVDTANLTRGGPGAWTATVTYNGIEPTGTFQLSSVVYYNLSQSKELTVAGPAVLKPGESYTFHFTILVGNVDSLQHLRYGGRGTAYHQHTDKAIGDNGDYDKWNTMDFSTGSTLVIGTAKVVDVGGVSLLQPILRRWGQVLGFTGAFLVIPSLVFGGTFGKRTVEPLNRLFGGARRRVLFHNSMSFWLLGIGVLHMLIMFYEAFWPWSHGLVWGGLSLAAMVGLGVTGATQRRFVARWGFARWRFVHFAMGILVFVFVSVHTVVDGSHLAPIRGAIFGPDPSING